MIRAVLVALVVSAAPVAAQTTVTPPNLSALTATMQQVQAVAASACQPLAIVPPSETVGGSGGTGASCRLANAVQPRITRAGLASTTDANGSWSITWSTPLPAAPVALPIPVNTGSQPLVCNITTSTATGATGRCWLARVLPSTILTLTALASFDPNGAPASGVSVQVLAIPVTQ